MNTEIITDRAIYDRVIQGAIPAAREFVWIATSDIKDLHVSRGKRMFPFLKVLSELISADVNVRLIHAREPGPRFRSDFDRYPNLNGGLERLLCPRVHFKSVIVDGTFAYTGSANLTGAGMGAKSSDNRNFETGVISTDPAFVEQVMSRFDAVWMGAYCRPCGRQEYCPDYKDMI